MSLIPVDGQPGIYRDTRTNAIINKNTTDYNNYIKQKKSRESKDLKMKEMQDQIDTLNTNVSEIKDLIWTLIKDKHT